MTATTPTPDNTLPPAFASLEAERQRIERILDRLDVADDSTERADLASELVRSTSRYEDTLERVVWPLYAEEDGAFVANLENDRAALRDSMQVIHDATKHVDARNVHAPDPQGYEDALDDVRVKVRGLLDREDQALVALDASLTDEEERTRIDDELQRVQKSASEAPVPPKTSFGRFLSNMSVKVDSNLEDASTPSHPAQETTKE